MFHGDVRQCQDRQTWMVDQEVFLLGKSLCQVLRRRLHLIVEPWGFCLGHGRLYQPFILAQPCEVSWEYANLMYICFVNLEKAYDCVSPSKVCLVSIPVCSFHGKDINRQPRLARCPVWGHTIPFLLIILVSCHHPKWTSDMLDLFSMLGQGALEFVKSLNWEKQIKVVLASYKDTPCLATARAVSGTSHGAVPGSTGDVISHSWLGIIRESPRRSWNHWPGIEKSAWADLLNLLLMWPPAGKVEIKWIN